MPSVSQGVAPDQASSAATLVEVADRALYTAQAPGRNSSLVAETVDTSDPATANRTEQPGDPIGRAGQSQAR